MTSPRVEKRFFKIVTDIAHPGLAGTRCCTARRLNSRLFVRSKLCFPGNTFFEKRRKDCETAAIARSATVPRASRHSCARFVTHRGALIQTYNWEGCSRDGDAFAGPF